MKEIDIKLTIEEANTIIDALSKMPFYKVYKIIEKIHIQVGSQVKDNPSN